MRRSSALVYAFAVFMSTLIVTSGADPEDTAGQHGQNHPAVFIGMPWLECECKAGREQGGTPRSIRASECREGGEVYWNVPLSGLVAGFVYTVEIEFVMGDTTVSPQVDILYLSASTSSYTVRQPTFALRQKKHSSSISMCLWDAYTSKTTPFQIEVTVCDMHPGLTSEEAVVGRRNLDSAANAVRVRCTDLESGEQTNMPDGGKDEWQHNFSAVVEDVGLSYSETVVALAMLNRYGLDGWARSSLNTSDDDHTVSYLHITAVVFNHKQDSRRASAEGMLRAVGFHHITFQPTYDIETLDLAALESSGRVSDNWDYHASEIGWNDVSNVSKKRYIAHALDFQDAIARHAAAATEHGPASWIAVFEDDIVLTTSPAQANKRLVEAVRSLPRNADVLYVEWCGDDCEGSRFCTQYPLISLAFKPHCSAGIMFSAQGARKLDRLLRPIDSTIDNMFANLCRGSVLICYKLRLPIFTQDRKWGSAFDFTKQKEAPHFHDFNLALCNEVIHFDLDFWSWFDSVRNGYTDGSSSSAVVNGRHDANSTACSSHFIKLREEVGIEQHGLEHPAYVNTLNVCAVQEVHGKILEKDEIIKSQAERIIELERKLEIVLNNLKLVLNDLKI